MKCLNPVVIFIPGEPLSWRRRPHGYGDGRAHGHGRAHGYGRAHGDGHGRGGGRVRGHDDLGCGDGEGRKAFSCCFVYGLNNIYTYCPPVTYLLDAWCCSVKKKVSMCHKSLYLLVKSDIKFEVKSELKLRCTPSAWSIFKTGCAESAFLNFRHFSSL